MSIKVYQHVLSSSFPVNASATILAGQVVTLNSSGEVILADNDLHTWALGIAFDAKSTLAAGAFANRAWELGDETSGPVTGKITVLHGPGTMVYLDTTDAITGAVPAIGTRLWVSGTAGKLQGTAPGGNDVVVGRVMDNLSGNSGYLDSGIPNVNVPVTDSDTPRTFALVRLSI